MKILRSNDLQNETRVRFVRTIQEPVRRKEVMMHKTGVSNKTDDDVVHAFLLSLAIDLFFGHHHHLDRDSRLMMTGKTTHSNNSKRQIISQRHLAHKARLK